LRNNLITFKNTFTTAFIPSPKANDNRQEVQEKGVKEVAERFQGEKVGESGKTVSSQSRRICRRATKNNDPPEALINE